MRSFCRTCNEFAEILGAQILSQENNVCTVTFMRDINVKILGRRTQSPDNPRLMYIHFESIDRPLDFARKVAEALRVLRK